MTLRPDHDWSKVHSGCYQSRRTGYRIEKSCNGGWNVTNAEGKLVDNLPTKRRAQEIYS